MDRVIRFTLGAAVSCVSMVALASRAGAQVCEVDVDAGSQVGYFSATTRPLDAADCDRTYGLQSAAVIRWVAPRDGGVTFIAGNGFISLRDEVCSCETAVINYISHHADLVAGQEVRVLVESFLEQEDITLTILQFGDAICTTPNENWINSPDDCPLASYSGTISWNGFVARSGELVDAFTAPLVIGAEGHSAQYSVETWNYTPMPKVVLASCPEVSRCGASFSESGIGAVVNYHFDAPVVSLEPGETRTGVDISLPDIPFQIIEGTVEVLDSEVTGGLIQMDSRPSAPAPGLYEVFMQTVVPVEPGGAFTAVLTRELNNAYVEANVTTSTCAKPLGVRVPIDGHEEGQPLVLSIVPPPNLPPGFIEGVVAIPVTADGGYADLFAINLERSEVDCAGGQYLFAAQPPPGPYATGPLTPGPFLMLVNQVWYAGLSIYQYTFAPRPVQVSSGQTVNQTFGFAPAVLRGTIDLLGGVLGPNVTSAFTGAATAAGTGGDSLALFVPPSSSLSYDLPLDPEQGWSLSTGMIAFFEYPSPHDGASTRSDLNGSLSRALPVSGPGSHAGPTENELLRGVADATMTLPLPAGSIDAGMVWSGRRTGPDHPGDIVNVSAVSTDPAPAGALDVRATLLPGTYAPDYTTASVFDPETQSTVFLDVAPMTFDVDAHDVVTRTVGSPDLAELSPAYGETCGATIPVSGVATAVHGDVAAVSVDGTVVSSAAGQFQATIVNPIGSHVFSVAATSTLGESNVQQRTVIRPFTVIGFLPPGVPLVPVDQGAPPTPTTAYKAGATIPLRLQHTSCGQLVATGAEVPSAPRIVSVERIGTQAPSTVIDTGVTVAPDASLFRFTDGGTWVNNLSTKGLRSGTYLLTVEVTGGARYHAAFALK